MDLFEAVYARRSVKHYDPAHRLTQAEVDKLLGAAIQSPTSFNIQHWRFVLVDDPALRQQIREAAFNQAQVTEASLLIVMTADLKAWRKDPRRYWQHAPTEVNDLLSGWMVPFHAHKNELQRDEAQRSIGMAMQTIMLAAKAMGYDSCPMIGFEHEKVASMINLPDDHCIGPMIAIGKALKPAWPKPGQLPLASVIVKNRFQA